MQIFYNFILMLDVTTDKFNTTVKSVEECKESSPRRVICSTMAMGNRTPHVYTCTRFYLSVMVFYYGHG